MSADVTTRLAISLRGVVKRFGRSPPSTASTWRCPSGVCFGLLGPNGAGKSTTMRMLTAQTLADEGEIEVLGYELPRESKQARLEMGVVPQLDNLDVELTGRQILDGVRAPVPRAARRARRAAVERALDIANLSPRADTIVRELSGGMRRRLLVARGLIHRPRLVLLDEPTVGLDPQVRQELWSLIDGLRADGVTVLMCTHYIEEAERLADTVAVMSRGPDHRPGHAGRAGQRARRASRCSRSTGRPRSWPRSRRWPPSAAGPTGAAARRWRSCAPSRSTARRPRACAARPTSRTRSWR